MVNFLKIFKFWIFINVFESSILGRVKGFLSCIFWFSILYYEIRFKGLLGKYYIGKIVIGYGREE